MPPPNEAEFERNEEIVRYHQPSAQGLAKISNMREATLQFLNAIDANCPTCADSTFAKRLVRMAMMSANASIVLDGLV